MTNTERGAIEQRIIERGTPANLARFREMHSQDEGEPLSVLSEHDLSTYEQSLQTLKVDETSASYQAARVRLSCSQDAAAAGRIKSILRAFTGIVNLQREAAIIPIETQENVVYKEKGN